MPTNRHRSRSRATRSGMTLLEVILAIAVAGFVLAAATSFVVSVSDIWVRRQDRHFFEDHVDGVAEFVRAAFANAGVEVAALESGTPEPEPSPSGEDPPPPPPPEPSDPDPEDKENTEKTRSGGLVRTPDEPVGWKRPPGFAEYQDPLLNFKIAEAPPLLVGVENAPVLGIDAYLHWERDEGLSLLWHSTLQEETEDLNDLRRTELSTLVTEVHYIYWDERFEKWEEEDAPKKGEGNDQFLLPRFVKLVFEYKGETKERIVTIPVPSKSAFIF